VAGGALDAFFSDLNAPGGSRLQMASAQDDHMAQKLSA